MYDENPVHNMLIKNIGVEHKVGFFESVEKLIKRSAMEQEYTFMLLWEADCIKIKNNSSGEELTLSNSGSASDMFDKF